MDNTIFGFAYLLSAVLFILALKGLSPVSARQGNIFGMIGMAIAVKQLYYYMAQVLS